MRHFQTYFAKIVETLSGAGIKALISQNKSLKHLPATQISHQKD